MAIAATEQDNTVNNVRAHATRGGQEVIRGTSALLAAERQQLQAFALVGRLARLGCTRIGSPGIFGEHAL